MVFQYSSDNRTEIIAYEDSTYAEHFKTIDSYRELFSKYGCELQVERFWYNSISQEVSTDRMPFVNGYQCAINCNVVRGGKIVTLDDEEICFSASWAFSVIKKRYGFPFVLSSFLQVTILSDTCDVENQLKEYLRLLESHPLH